MVAAAFAPAVIALGLLTSRGLVGRWTAPGRQPVAVLPAMEAVLRRDGLAAALDSLEGRAAADSSLQRGGHQLAHALGRDAVALAGGNAAVLRQCRPSFASGCYHGVVEAALQSAGRIDMPGLERLCLGLADSAGPAPGFECLHGLGHGVLGARQYDLAATLRDCDALSTDRRRTSCHLGAFMEAVNAALGTSAVGGAAAARAGMADMHHHGVAAPLAVDPDDRYSPCRAFGDPYANSCWLFQGFVILRAVNFDAGRALTACAAAPAVRAGRCAEGVGHQLTGLFQRGDGWVVEQCGRGPADIAAHCASGATLALDAMDWSGARSARFCAAAPEAWKPDCYRTAADALVDLASPDRRRQFCDAVEPAYAGPCRDAALIARADRS